MSEEKKNVLDEKLNPSYPEGVQELAEVLDFLPEEVREGLVRGFFGLMLAN